MDRLELEQRIKTWIGRYRYVLLVVLLGIFLMLLPSGKEKDPPVEHPAVAVTDEQSVDEQLTQILAQIQGVGRVQVMLTEATGAETIYQTDEDRTDSADSTSLLIETVIISGNGTQTGLVRTVSPPTFLGAIVVCQGGDDPSVRLAVAQAVSVVTGISTDRITVLKMK